MTERSGAGSYEVVIERCDGYDPDRVRAAIKASLAHLGGIGSFTSPGDRVLVKLNLLSPRSPDDAVTTHPVVAGEVVKLLQDEGAEVLIGDSPGGRNTPTSYQSVLKRTGMDGVIRETGCKVVFFDAETVDITSRCGGKTRKFTVGRIVTEADRIIALPKLKAHQLTVLTGAVKLLYGYIPGVRKAEYHLVSGMDTGAFADLLVDLAVTIPPACTIMDAIVGMEGNGPSHGNPRPIGLIMAGTSCTALDYVAAGVLGIDPHVIPTIHAAALRGDGPASLEEIRIMGEAIETVRIHDFVWPDTASAALARLPPSMRSILQRLLTTRPAIDPSRCTMCGVCAANCPAGAIVFSGDLPPRIRYQRCIRCYCCQELCPGGAVIARKPALRRLID